MKFEIEIHASDHRFTQLAEFLNEINIDYTHPHIPLASMHSKKMTPKDKAKDIVSKFFDYVKYDETSRFNARLKERKANAKQCALIAVDELIKENAEIEEMVGQGFNLNFWQQVKEEIEKNNL